jgi:hypothetical protein
MYASLPPRLTPIPARFDHFTLQVLPASWSSHGSDAPPRADLTRLRQTDAFL